MTLMLPAKTTVSQRYWAIMLQVKDDNKA